MQFIKQYAYICNNGVSRFTNINQLENAIPNDTLLLDAFFINSASVLLNFFINWASIVD